MGMLEYLGLRKPDKTVVFDELISMIVQGRLSDAEFQLRNLGVMYSAGAPENTLPKLIKDFRALMAKTMESLERKKSEAAQATLLEAKAKYKIIMQEADRLANGP